MKTNSQKATYKAQSENIVNIHTPGDDTAGIDPDYDTFTDDELEIRNGLYRHALAHGEVANG